MSLFRSRAVTLASGAGSWWKLECDALDTGDWATLAGLLVPRLPRTFAHVLGVPRGGLAFAAALAPFADPVSRWVLVVDDVWTTGGSMTRFVAEYVPSADRPAMMAVAFARGPVPSHVTALWQLAPRDPGPLRT